MLMKTPRVLSNMVVSGLFACLFVPQAALAAKDGTTLVPHIREACDAPEDGKAFVRVAVEGLKDMEGNIRVQVYGPSKEEFLEKGKKLVRLDVPTEEEGQVICVPTPAPGKYTLVVMHDRNANGKADFFSEGFGFSNNPKLGLAPPDAEEVVFEAKAGVTEMNIRLKYIFGANEEQKKKRRQLRRR